jgi:hypothetical protein
LKTRPALRWLAIAVVKSLSAGPVKTVARAAWFAEVGLRSALVSTAKKLANAASAAWAGSGGETGLAVVAVVVGVGTGVADPALGVAVANPLTGEEAGGDVAVAAGVALSTEVVAVGELAGDVRPGPDVLVTGGVPCELWLPQPEVATTTIVAITMTRFEVATRMGGSVRHKSDMSCALTPVPPFTPPSLTAARRAYHAVGHTGHSDLGADASRTRLSRQAQIGRIEN